MAGLSSTAVAVLAFQFLCALLIANAQKVGFTVDLIHHDSPECPFYNPNETTHQRLTKAYHSSLSRFQQRSLTTNSGGSPYADIIPQSGGYLMKIQIGTPPVEILAAADTGSDLIWTQCWPCIHCYEQTAPIFNPSASSTYKDAPCGSSQCQAVHRIQCDAYDDSCPYHVRYADNSFTIGNVGIDTLTLRSTSGQPVSLPESIIGCGHNNTGYFPSMSGVVGLGWGPSSLVSQMGDMIQGLFAYCFGPTTTYHTSKINFGANAIVSGDGTVSTPLFRKDFHRGNYFLNLDAISVNQNRVETSGTSFHATDGNIIIDSGSTFTFFPRDYYSRLEAAVATATKVARTDFSSMFKLCYKSSNLADFPRITMHFTDADLFLDPVSVFVSPAPGISCLTLMSHDSIPPLFGNVAQQNFLVGYDTISSTVSFKPTDCHALWS